MNRGKKSASSNDKLDLEVLWYLYNSADTVILGISFWHIALTLLITSVNISECEEKWWTAFCEILKKIPQPFKNYNNN